MNSKLIGGILLIIGTSIGGGMLALPTTTAAGGFGHALFLFLAAWVITVLAAFYILEVNLWLPDGANFSSMARATLGRGGQVVAWVTELLLLYCLIAAYTAGGSDLLQGLFTLIHLDFPRWVDSVLFMVVLGSILFFGVYVVDIANRFLMTIKLIAYVVLIALIVPHVNFANFPVGHVRLLDGAVMVVVTSFGYATIIPTLRSYFNSDVKKLRQAITIGSFIPLICYLLWDFVVQGTVPSIGAAGLTAMTHSGHAVSQLSNALSTELHSWIIDNTTRLFTSICVTTSFLGVALCLTDFIADGLGVVKKGFNRWLVITLTLVPPLVIALFFPRAFILGLSFAGVCCVILLILLPALMVYSGRYILKTANGYQVCGGKTLVVIEIIVAAALLIFGSVHIS